jgi:hypothetical protein
MAREIAPIGEVSEVRKRHSDFRTPSVPIVADQRQEILFHQNAGIIVEKDRQN